jgi:multidrug efflux system outer membrane protein
VRRAGLLGAAVLLLAACTLGPDYRRPPVEAPPGFRGDLAPGSDKSLGDLGWREIFADDTLRGLIEVAIAQNYDVRVAAARILDARAQVTVARSFQFPDLSASGDATYSRIAGDRDPLQLRESFAPNAGLDLFFELDLWGRFRRGTEAARAELLGSVEARRFVITSLIADLATAYFQLRSLDEELEISRRTLGSREGSLQLVKARQEGGVAGLLDVRQSEILVATAAETIPDTQRQIEQIENAIAILLGRLPDAVPRGRPLGEQLAVGAVPAGFPSSLLERRPDVRGAEQQLAAATARIGIAKADYFPRLFLTGAAHAGGLWVSSSWFGPQGLFAVGPSFTLPIFNAGRVGAGVDSAEAQAQAAMLQYQQVVLGAFRDVSDSLVEHARRREARVYQEALAVAAVDATRLANIRYTGGVTTYLEVQDAERQAFDAELALVRLRRDELLAVVRLYKALGGGWQEAAPER